MSIEIPPYVDPEANTQDLVEWVMEVKNGKVKPKHTLPRNEIAKRLRILDTLRSKVEKYRQTRNPHICRIGHELSETIYGPQYRERHTLEIIGLLKEEAAKDPKNSWMLQAADLLTTTLESKL